MLRLHGKTRIQVPNRLAVLAALLLAFSGFASLRGDHPQDVVAAGVAGAAKSGQTAVDEQERSDSTESGRILNLRLLLFRHG